MANAPSPLVIRWGPTVLLALTLGVGLTLQWMGPTHGVLGFAEVARVSVVAPYEGRVAAVLVREGDRVLQGDVLARLDSVLLAAEIEVLQATADMLEAAAQAQGYDAQTAVDELETSRAEARSSLAEARGEAAALRTSVAQRRGWVQEGLGGADELARDEVDLAAATARARGLEELVGQLDRALEALRAGAAPDAAGHRAALQELEVVKREIDLLTTQRDMMTLRAEADGYVAALYVREGAMVSTGLPLFDLVPHHAQRAVICATEAEAAAIEPGQRALLWPVDGRPAVDATVLSVGALVAEPDLRCRTMMTRAEFVRPIYLRLDEEARLPSGIRLTARFLAAREPVGGDDPRLGRLAP
jgi:multidrug resistance efflux pump